MKFNKDCDTLLHFSGGMDSTYVLYDYLKKHPDRTILVHHVLLRNKNEDRLIHEKKAVKDILSWLTANGYNNYVYHESTFDYGSLYYISLKDIQIVSVFTAIIMKSRHFVNIKNLLLSWHKGEVNRQDINKGYRIRLALQGFQAREPELIFPIENMTRKDMARNMPEDLLRLVWCCRKPLSNGRHCGVCHTCKELCRADLFRIVNIDKSEI